MKKLYLNLFLITALLFIAYISSAQNVIIPDANFKAYLVGNPAINTNSDAEIQFSEATAFTGTIDANSLSISDLTGIEAFIALTALNCSNNSLASLDVSNNTLIEVLNCGSNALSNLDLSNNTALISLYCFNNSLSNLDVSNNTLLEIISCTTNSLTSLDLSNNTALTEVQCGYNDITTIDLTSNTALELIDCSFNLLNSLDVRNGNNANITSFDARNNPNLSCINASDVTYATANWTNIDAGTSFSTDCGALSVTIPDANFKAYLVGNAAINTNSDTEIQFSEATAFTGTIDANSLSISDLTGIEAFIALTALNCSNNSLASLDVKYNTALTTLNCDDNTLTGLDISTNTALAVVTCDNNSLSSLDLSNNTLLEIISCTTNSLTSLDLSNNTALTEVQCGYNDITTIDLTSNTALELIDCSFNLLNSLDVRNGNNANITSFDARNNSNLSCINASDVTYATANWTNIDAGASFSTDCGALPVTIPDANFKAYLVGNPAINTNSDAEIQFSEATAFTGTIDANSLSISDLTGIEAFIALTALNCSNNSLASLDVSNNTLIEVLNCGSNALSNLDLSNNTALISLYCFNNSLSNLDVSNNTLLEIISCTTNSLTSLDLSNNTALTEVQCGYNDITTIDLTSNTALELIDCSFNLLNSLDVRNGNNANITSFDARNNPNLSCINASDVTYATANWTNIDAGTSFSTDCGALSVTIPDANFKAYLVGNAAINTNSDTEIQFSEATAFTGTIDANSLSISDLTGIEAFIALTALNCSNNSLASLDVKYNTALTTLNCDDNTLTGLDISTNTALAVVTCDNNSLSSLDLSNNTLLEIISCTTNSLTSLDLSNNTALTEVQCGYNDITTIDLTSNTALELIDCSFNLLNSLDVRNGNNANITSFDARNNSNLSCINASDVTYATANWTNIDAGASFSTDCGALPVTIPDANFKAYLVGNPAINTNSDAEIQFSEATAFTGTIDANSLSISDLTGIEAFIALTALNCSNNSLASLDVSNNTLLEVLNCGSNALSNLDLSNNTALISLYCFNNSLSNLDVSNNTLLEIISCTTNSLTSLDLSNNTALTEVQCGYNDITTIDLTSNTALELIDCSFNLLNSLDVRNGNNANITSFDARNNPNLSCINASDVTYATANWTNIDAGTSFSTDCGALSVTIPDANFKAYLVGNAAINTNSDTEIQFSEATAFTGTIDANSLSISDLTGIEAFIALTALNCSNNSLASLDVKYNTALTTLNCDDNTLTGLDISTNTALAVVTCDNNSLSSLDLSNNTLLEIISCTTNSLTSLDLSNNTALTEVQCGYNDITTIDLTSNTALELIDCSFNLLNSLDVRNGNNANITSFDARNNSNLSCINASDVTYATANWTNIDAGASFSTDCGALPVTIPDANFKAYLVGNPAINTNSDAEIQFSEATAFTGTIDANSLSISDLTGIEAFIALTALNCSNNSLASLDVSNNTLIEVLNCGSNALSNLDLSNNTALISLYCFNNSLSNLDVSNNTLLEIISCTTNSLTSLDLSNNTALTEVQCGYNDITTINLTSNTALELIDCSFNLLNSLDVRNGNNANITSFDARNNPNLSCISVSDVAFASANWTNIDAGASFLEADCDRYQEISFDPVSNKTYGDANFDLTASSSSGLTVTFSSTNLAVATVSGKTITILGAGTTTIIASQAGDTNYDPATDIPQDLIISKAMLTATANDQSKLYGETNPSLSITYTGFVLGEDQSVIDEEPTASSIADENSIVGTYPITVSGGADNNYDFSYAEGTLTVDKAVLTASADDQSKLYGDANPSLSITYTGFVLGEDQSVIDVEPTASSIADENSIVGTYPITVSGGADNNYNFSYNEGTLNIEKAILTATADNKSKIFGDLNPTFTFKYSGFVLGEDESVIDVLPKAGTSADENSIVGVYPITVSGGSDNNYDFSYAEGTLTVDKAVLTASADNQSKLYGDANPSLSITYAGFVLGEDQSVIDVEPIANSIADENSIVGTYPITVSGGADNNYDFSYAEGTLTVNKAVLTASADDQSKLYGDANPSLSITYTGFVLGEDQSVIDVLPTASTTADENSPVNSYPITVTGGEDNNYDFSYNEGTLSIEKAILTASADDKSKIFGDINPSLTLTYSGFVLGEDESVIDVLPTISTLADQLSSVGSYDITVSGGLDDNYDFDYITGTLSINKALLDVIADNKARPFGEANPTLTVSYSGFVLGEDLSVIDVLPTASTTADENSPVNSYPITVSGGVDDNYDFNYIDGFLTVGKITLTATADDLSKFYGDANPPLTVTYSGFVHGDDESDIDVHPIGNTVANEQSPVNSYIISLSGGVDDKYNFVYIDGTLNVEKAILTASADNKTKSFGELNPTFTITYSGFVLGEDEGVLDQLPIATTTADESSPANTYAITVAEGNDNNYDFYYINGILVVSKASQTISFDVIDNQLIEDKTLTLVASASSNLEVTFEIISGPATISGNTLNFTDIGSVTIEATQAGNSNYLAATPVQQSFEIITITSLPEMNVNYSVYPNPTTDYINLNIENMEISEIELLQLDGTKICEFNSKNSTLDLSDIKAGIYILKISSDKGLFHQRIIKN